MDFYRGQTRTRSWAMAAHSFQRAISFGQLAQVTHRPGLRGTMPRLQRAPGRLSTVQGVTSTPSQRTEHGETWTFCTHPLDNSRSCWRLPEGRSSCPPREVKRWVISLHPGLAGLREHLCLPGKSQAWPRPLLHFEERCVLKLRHRPPKCF